MVDMRQEHAQIDDALEKEHKRRGEYITWFELIAPVPATDYDPVYDTGITGTGGLTYKAGVQVPVLWVIEKEDQRTPRPEGRQTFQTVSFSCTYTQLLQAGISQPWESTIHVRDLVYVDGRYYKLWQFENQGRLQDAEVAVVCRGTETYIDQELAFDPGPALPTTNDWQFPPTFPVVR